MSARYTDAAQAQAQESYTGSSLQSCSHQLALGVQNDASHTTQHENDVRDPASDTLLEDDAPHEHGQQHIGALDGHLQQGQARVTQLHLPNEGSLAEACQACNLDLENAPVVGNHCKGALHL